MRLGFQQRLDRVKSRKRRPIGEYSYGVIQLEQLEERVLMAGAPAQIIFTQQPPSVAAGSPLFPSIQVTVLDASGQIVTNATNSIMLSVVTPLGGTIAGTTRVNAAGGVATFSNVQFPQTGIYTLTANDTVAGLSTINPITITVNSAATKLAFATQPTDITAVETFSLKVNVENDSGIVTSDHSNVTLSISSGPPGATLNGTSTVTVTYPTGQATFSGLNISTPGTYTLQARDSQTGIAVATSSTFTVTAGAATRLAFAQQPTTTLVSTTVTPPITVNILDVRGNIVTTDNSAVTLSITENVGPADATIAGTTTVNAVNGVATFNDISFASPALVYTLTASDGLLTNATSSAFSVAGTPVKLAFENAPAQSTVATLIKPIVVRVQDSLGSTVPNDSSTVTLTLNTGPGTMSGTTSVQAVNGRATFDNISFNEMGTYVITASDGSLTPATSASFIVNGLPAKLAFQQQPSSVAAGVAITPVVKVLVQDSAGNTVIDSTASVSITLGSYTGSGSNAQINGITVVNAVNGVATFSSLIPSTAGIFTLKASSGTLTEALSNSFTVAPAATQLNFATGPSNVASGSTMYPAVVINILNDIGQIVTTNTTSVTLAVVEGPKGFTLNGSTAGTLTVAAVAGVATFSTLRFTVPGTYVLLAYDGDLATATSHSFTVTQPPKKLQWAAQPTQSVVAGQTMPAMSVWVQDRNGNLIESDHSVLTLAIESGPTGGTIVSGATVNADHGTATFSNVKFNVAGKYVLTVSSGSLTVATSKYFYVVPDRNSPQMVVTQSPTSTLVGKAFTSNVIVKIQDQFGNALDVKQPVVLSTADPTSTSGTMTSTPVLSGTKTLYTNHGWATFSGLSVPDVPAGGTMTIWAYAPALDSTDNVSSFNLGITKVLTITRKPSVAGNYGVDKAFTLSTDMRGLVSSAALWSGSAKLVDSQNNVLGTDDAVGTNGGISITVPNGLTAGTYTARIQYAGDNNHTGGASPTLTLVVGPGTTVSLAASSTKLAAGSTLTLTATVKTSATGAQERTGTLTLKDGTTVLDTLTLDATSDSKAVFTLASPGTGSHTYTVVYTGDSNFRGSTSSKLTVTVNSQATTLSLVASAAQVEEGQQLDLTATVNVKPANPAATARTGTLTLMEGASTVGTIVLSSISNSMGVFALAAPGGLPAPVAGVHDYTVLYSGDPIFLSSVSPTVRVTVIEPTIAG